MNQANPYWASLEAALGDTSGIIVPKGDDEATYFEKLRSSIRAHATAAEKVSAIVVEPGFSHRELGTKITGYLLARSEGYWLVFEPLPDTRSIGQYGRRAVVRPLHQWRHCP